MLNQYQRRADLVPNLVNVVKGYAEHEKDVLTQVTEARAKVGSMQITPEVLNNPDAFAKFQAAQGELSSALSRLMVAVSYTHLDVYKRQVYEKTHDAWQVVLAPGLYKPTEVPPVQGDGWVGAGSGWQAYSEQLSLVYGKQLHAVQPQALPTAAAILALAKPIVVSGNAKSAGEAMPIYIRNRVALKSAEREQGIKL